MPPFEPASSPPNEMDRAPAGRRPALAILVLFFLLVYGRYLAGFAPSGGDIVNQYLPYQQLVRNALRDGVWPYWNSFTFCGRPLMADIQVGVLYPPNWLHWILSLPLSFALLLALHGAWMLAGCWMLGHHWRLHPAAIALGAILFCASPFFTLKASQGIVLFVYVGAWWPWIALATHRLIDRPSFARLALLSVTLALSLLAGSPQITYYGWLAACALALFLPNQQSKREAGGDARAPSIPHSAFHIPHSFISLAWLAGAFALAFGLTAVQTFQTAGFIGASFERGGPGGAGWDYVVDGSLAPRLFWLLLNPGMLGLGYSEGALYFGSQLDFAEACFYAPLWVPVLLLPLSLLILLKNNLQSAISNLQSDGEAGKDACATNAPQSAIRNPQSAILHRRLLLLGLLAMVLGLTLAPGEYSPLFRLFYKFFPGFNRFRVPARLMVFFFSGQALVAALALHHLLVRPISLPAQAAGLRSVRVWAVAGALIALALLWIPFACRVPLWRALGRATPGFDLRVLYSPATFHALWVGLRASIAIALAAIALWQLAAPARRAWAPWVLPAVAAAELILLALPFQKTVFFTKYIEAFYPRTQLVAELQREHRGGRVLWLDDVHSWLLDQNQPEVYPNRMVMHGLPEARGYDPVNARWIGIMMNLLAGRPPDENPRGFMFVPRLALPGLLPLLAVETVVSYEDLSGVPGLRPAWRKNMRDQMRRPCILTVWRNERFRGMAFPAPLPAMVRTEAEAMLTAARIAGDRATSTTLPAAVTPPMFEEGLPPLATAVDERFVVKPLDHDANSFGYQVDFPAPALLCLAQSVYDGWSATIDGEPARHLGALSGTFLAVAVPAGRHEVVFDFLPDGLAQGQALSLAALVVLIYGLVRGRLRRKPETAYPSS